jgi:Mg-chelatase subunit ChlD
MREGGHARLMAVSSLLPGRGRPTRETIMRQTVRYALALAVVGFGVVPAGLSQRPVAPPARAVTFDDVVRQVRAGKTPGEILENCDVVFTLTPDQRNELLTAGAPKSLVDALQVKRIAIDDVTDYVVILDCSGSMKDEIGPGQTKMDAARAVVGELFRAVPNGRNLAFIVYGHDAALECRAVKVVRPLGPVDDEVRRELAFAVDALRPVGHTPIAASLRAAGEVLAKSEGMSQVVLITDGVETCKGDPAAEAERLVAAVKGLRAVEVVGVGLKKPGEKEAVALIARRGRGKFYNPETAADLKRDIEGATGVKLVKEVPPVEDKVPEDLPPALKALVEDLKDKSGRVRREAADALAKLGEKAKPTAPALAARVADDVFDSTNSFTRNGDPDGGCKAAALEALQKVAPDRVEGALLKARKSKNEAIRAWATKKLGEIIK